MRLHHLQVTAFGPFAETVDVDFDELSDAGLFLLSGATGAGKTSVLDAVCFALYGDVPGDRSSAKRLRCDQADPAAVPRVVLEATLSGRRFRIVRSPAWARPKKRGDGTTPQQATVTIAERVGGEWQPRSSRLDETGHLVTSLVGMNLPQFVQVAMLPQGQFQAFLRARSEDRQQLLQQLFRTGRFAQVERWLREHRVELRRACAAAQDDVADVLSRISEVTASDPPTDLALTDRSSLLSWAESLHVSAQSDEQAATAATARAEIAEAQSRAALESARSRHERRARYDAARAERQDLAGSDDHADQVLRLDAARRAGSMVPWHRLALQARVQHATADQAAGEMTAELTARVGRDLTTPSALSALVTARVEAGARVRALLPRALRLAQIDAQLGDLRELRSVTAVRLTEVAERRAAAPARVAALHDELTHAQAASGALVTLVHRIESLETRLSARREAEKLARATRTARAGWRASREAALTAREGWLSVREARLESMAAEIAGALAVGACCPVCGSAEHPHKASPAPGAPDASDEKAALRTLDDANATEHLRDSEVRDFETRLAAALARAGAEADLLDGELRSATDERSRLTERAAGAEGLSRELEAARAAVTTDDDLASELGVELAQHDAAAGALDEQRGALADEVALALDGSRHHDLADLAAEHLNVAEAARAALTAVASRVSAASAVGEAERALAEAAVAGGFDSVDQALAAVLRPAEVDRLADLTADHERRLASLAQVLSEPGADDAGPLPALDDVATAHTAALTALGEATARSATALTRSRRLTTLREALVTSVDSWLPVRADLELATRVSSFAEGKAPDNRLQMRLSAYVLAYRLSQVVAAANGRLARMSDQRYSLEHTGRRGAGETRGGLSLLVRDDWSGESRDPATLSGGETFVVSLALALGLADVITQESGAGAGGSGLDTLFVDEGFGSLDAETLDDVMDVLDSLRDGGRVVGVVSHVAEMRERIPTQLLVSKAPRGSRVVVRR